MRQASKKMTQIKVRFDLKLFIVLLNLKWIYLIEEIAQKYRELRKREVVMDEFLGDFETNKQTETENLYNTRRTILNYLESISKVHFSRIKLKE